MAMTLDQVRDRLASWYGGSEACLDAKACAELGYMIAAIDAHLTQPAQAVDVGAIEAVIRELRTWRDEGTDSMARKLTRAIAAPPSNSPTTGAIWENTHGTG